MRDMDAIVNISLTTMPKKTIYTTTVGATAQFSDFHPSIPSGLLATPGSTQAIQPTGSPPASPALPSPSHLLQQMLRYLNYQSLPYRKLEAKLLSSNRSGIHLKAPYIHT